jgi:hypothetical protein
VVMTSSKENFANKIPTFAKYPIWVPALLMKTPEKNGYKNKFSHTNLTSTGLPVKPLECNPDRVTMVDASEMIKIMNPKKISRSHGKIYNREVSRFVWEAIKSCIL